MSTVDPKNKKALTDMFFIEKIKNLKNFE